MTTALSIKQDLALNSIVHYSGMHCSQNAALGSELPCPCIKNVRILSAYNENTVAVKTVIMTNIVRITTTTRITMMLMTINNCNDESDHCDDHNNNDSKKALEQSTVFRQFGPLQTKQGSWSSAGPSPLHQGYTLKKFDLQPLKIRKGNIHLGQPQMPHLFIGDKHQGAIL